MIPCSGACAGETLPTAQMSSEETAEAPQNPGAAESRGVGNFTRCHDVPSQCSATRETPKAQTSVAEGATTASSPYWMDGTATWVHDVPSKCSTRGPVVRDRADAEPPSAEPSSNKATRATARLRSGAFMARTVLPRANAPLMGKELEDGGLAPRAPHLAERVAHLAHRHVGARTFEDRLHEVAV